MVDHRIEAAGDDTPARGAALDGALAIFADDRIITRTRPGYHESESAQIERRSLLDHDRGGRVGAREVPRENACLSRWDDRSARRHRDVCPRHTGWCECGESDRDQNRGPNTFGCHGNVLPIGIEV